MKLELKIGKTGRAIIGLLNSLLFAYLGVVFSFGISYSNPILFNENRIAFFVIVFLAFALVQVLSEIARRLGVRV